MTTIQEHSVLSEVEYLAKKVEKLLEQLTPIDNQYMKDTKEIYYQLGKLYSQIELLKRVQPYE